MVGQEEPRDLQALVVPQAGWLEHAEVRGSRVRLRDPAGVVVGPVAVFLRDLQASGGPETTLRAYAVALLRWYRFLWAAGVAWDQATRAEARDFCRRAPGSHDQARPRRPSGRCGRSGQSGPRVPGVPNPVTGKAPPGRVRAGHGRVGERYVESEVVSSGLACCPVIRITT